MKVKIHTLFQYLLETTEAAPEAIVGFSLAQSPSLGDFLDDLDPDMPLDWNNRDFSGLPELKDHVLRQAGLAGVCAPADVLITAGAAEANYLLIMQLLQPGDEIVRALRRSPADPLHLRSVEGIVCRQHAGRFQQTGEGLCQRVGRRRRDGTGGGRKPSRGAMDSETVHRFSPAR